MTKIVTLLASAIFLGYVVTFLQCTESRQSAITKIAIRNLRDTIKNCLINGTAPIYSGKSFFSKFQYCRLEEKVEDVYLYIDGQSLSDYLRQGGDTTNFTERVVFCVGDSSNVVYYQGADDSGFVLYTDNDKSRTKVKYEK